MIEEEVIGSQTEDSEQDNSMDDVYEAFGIEKEEKSEEDEKPNPATDKVETPKTYKVKHNKEEVEVDISSDEKLTDHLQRSLALDKERERREKNENLLKEAATLLGLESLDEATIERVRQERAQQQQQQAKDEYTQLRAELRQQADEAGLDPDKVEAWLDNHPLMKQAQQAIQEREETEIQKLANLNEQAWKSKWAELYQAYPDVGKDAEAFAKNERPAFYTEQFETLVNQGNHPLLVFEHLNRDKIKAEQSKKTEQRLIKEQQLGLRSRVETTTTQDNEPVVPQALADAFAAFDLPASAATKYVKK